MYKRRGSACHTPAIVLADEALPAHEPGHSKDEVHSQPASAAVPCDHLAGK